jgi:precorrin-2 dehydrogenase/sirohydrochlorin ferrochelatase
MLDLEQRLCLVVGGGPVATRKVHGLLAAGARVRLVAPDCSPELRRLAEAGRLEWRPRRYRGQDFEDATLLFAATSDRELNAALAAEARRRSVLANVADDPAGSDFQVPAVVERSGLTVALSTGGRSPAFARRLREQLEAWLTGERLELFELYAGLRAELKAAGLATGAVDWALVDHQALELLREGRRSEAARLLRRQVLVGVGGEAE